MYTLICKYKICVNCLLPIFLLMITAMCKLGRPVKIPTWMGKSRHSLKLHKYNNKKQTHTHIMIFNIRLNDRPKIQKVNKSNY